MIYLIGDVQGCCDAFERLLAAIGSRLRATGWSCSGDLVNRGPGSLATLRRACAAWATPPPACSATTTCTCSPWPAAAQAAPQRHAGRGAGLAPTRAWLEWLRQRRMAVMESGWLCVHAGVVPQWNRDDTLARAAEVEAMLRSDALDGFLHQMYADEPLRWSPALEGNERLRFIINVLTRIRFVDASARSISRPKEGAGGAPPGFYPLVRGTRAPHRRRADRLRPLVDTGPRQPPRAARAGHRLRVGRLAHRGARGRRAARGVPGGVRAGAGAGVSACDPRPTIPRPASEAWQSGRLHRSCSARSAAQELISRSDVSAGKTALQSRPNVGSVAEWSIAPVLKTGGSQGPVSSNLTASAKQLEKWGFQPCSPPQPHTRPKQACGQD